MTQPIYLLKSQRRQAFIAECVDAGMPQQQIYEELINLGTGISFAYLTTIILSYQACKPTKSELGRMQETAAQRQARKRNHRFAVRRRAERHPYLQGINRRYGA